VPKALKIYAKFLKEVLNDAESSEEYMNRAREMTNVK
jgi:hypothetical protein